MRTACSVRIRGVVQGVGFRPFVFRLARAHTLGGWVLNDDEGVEIHVEGSDRAVETFLHDLRAEPPPAARISTIDVSSDEVIDLHDFTIRESPRTKRPTARIAPDLAVCDACLEELFDPGDRRFGYPYINCTNCGPRFTVINELALRPAQHHDAPVVARSSPARQSSRIPAIGASTRSRSRVRPAVLNTGSLTGAETLSGSGPSIRRTARLLAEGAIVAVKGLGGYHLACDARNTNSVAMLRDRKYRKEKPFALMASDAGVARFARGAVRRCAIASRVDGDDRS